MCDVREIGLLRPDFFGGCKGFIDRKMRGVGSILQCIQNQDVQTMQQIPGFVGDEIDIGAIGEVVDAEAEDIDVAMHEGNGVPDFAEKVEWAVNQSRNQMWTKDFHIC